MSTKLDDGQTVRYDSGGELEARLDAACREADVTGTQKEILLLFLLDGLTARQIRLKLHGDVRLHQVRCELEQGLRKLAAKEPGFWEPAQRFPHDLVFCANDRRADDERPPGVRGVTSDRASDSLHTGRMISGDDQRLRQSLADAGRLWAQSLRRSIA